MFTVMVVDDNEAIRRGVSCLLKAGGYETVLAEDGVEALEMTETTPPDLILLDISMPVLDGLSLLEVVRDQPGWESLPVLVYSAVDDPTVRRRATRLGATFVNKGTTTWDDLVSTIAEHLRPKCASVGSA